MTWHIDRPLICAWIVLCAFGVVMVGSASVALQANHLPKHILFLAMGVLLMATVAGLPMALWQKLHRFAWVGAVGISVLVLVPGLGVEVNGARRWLDLGAFRLQASEVVKLLVLPYVAGYLARFDAVVSNDVTVLLRPLLMIAVVCLLLLLEPDFGTVVVLGVTTCGLLFMAGARLRHFLLVIVLCAAVLALLAVVQPYRVQRLTSFVDPWAFAFGSGYQLTQALIAFGRGELFGLGLGDGIQKLFYLPEAHNDFIFAVVAEELGAVGALALMALFGLLLMRIFRIGRLSAAEGRLFASYMAYGAGLLIAVQCLINIGVNTGSLPTKGLTLPFVSFGGNSLMVNCVLLGWVFRAYADLERVDE